MSRLPNFFIVGAPKAGTTSLYHYLDQHPQVYMSAIKSRTSLRLKSGRRISMPSSAVTSPVTPVVCASFSLVQCAGSALASCDRISFHLQDLKPV
jgi:hypothetical protein